jgi:hypothetical protein
MHALFTSVMCAEIPGMFCWRLQETVGLVCLEALLQMLCLCDVLQALLQHAMTAIVCSSRVNCIAFAAHWLRYSAPPA